MYNIYYIYNKWYMGEEGERGSSGQIERTRERGGWGWERASVNPARGSIRALRVDPRARKEIFAAGERAGERAGAMEIEIEIGIDR